jgi:sigma-B regulation protein RsbU (phosphoserine phosphatase)
VGAAGTSSTFTLAPATSPSADSPPSNPVDLPHSFALPLPTAYKLSGMPPPLLSLVVPSLTLSIPDLRAQVTRLAFGFLILVIGLAALALFFFRRRTRDLTLLSLGFAAVLYGLRLLPRESIIQSIFHISKPLQNHIDLWITCLILTPFLMFFLQVALEPGRTLVRWALYLQPIFVALAITRDLLGLSPSLARGINRIFVFTLIASMVANLPWFRSKASRKPLNSEYRILISGLLIFGAFVVYGNLADLRLVAGANIEPLGFLIFLAFLGYLAAHRIFANEEHLLAINKELQIANQIQSSILPHEVPRLAGLEIVARYVPMSAVAGDFYDFLVVDDRRVGILVADVTGHGVPAALIASMLKVAFAGQSAHADDPAHVLTGLNRALCGKFEEHFVTAAYVFVDLEKSLLRYAGAGHPPLLHASRRNPHARNSSREVEANGLMLGLFPEAIYSSLEIPLDPGDRVVLYTDGILESMNTAREEFGKSRLKKFLDASASSASHLADALLLELRRWSATDLGRAQDDDITLLVLDFLPSP